LIYIVLSILASSTLFVIFKLFGKFKVNSFQAIVFNYITACFFGFSVYGKPLNFLQLSNFNWFYHTLGLGLVFISVFYVMAVTTQKNGLSVVAVASKMSVVIPIMVGVFLYNENIGRLKVAGILIALASIYLVTVNPNKIKGSTLLYPFLVFLGSGLIDVSLKFLETHYVKPSDVSVFSNYFSIYFLIKAIGYKGMESSTFFIINNVGILLITALLGVILFREKLTQQNRLGILLAIVGIVLVSLSGSF